MTAGVSELRPRQDLVPMLKLRLRAGLRTSCPGYTYCAQTLLAPAVTGKGLSMRRRVCWASLALAVVVGILDTGTASAQIQDTPPGPDAPDCCSLDAGFGPFAQVP